MFRQEKLQKVRGALSAMERVPELWRLLDGMASADLEIQARISAMAGPGGKAEAEGANIARIISELPGALRKANPRVVLREIDYLHTSLGLTLGAEFGAHYEWLLVELDTLADSYSQYVNLQNSSNGHAFLRLASALMKKLVLLKVDLGFVCDVIFKDLNLEESEEVLEITLHSITSVSDVGGRLDAIGKIYNELARIYGVSTIDYPARLVSVESGSLRVTVFGKMQLIKLVVDCIRNVAAFIYRNYTREGQIGEIAAKAESVGIIVDLAKKLKENGIGADLVEEEAKKAAVALAKQASKLLAGEERITVNETSIELVPAGKATGRLEHSTAQLQLPAPGQDGIEL